MRSTCSIPLSLGLVFLAFACRAPLSIDPELARDADRLEIQIDRAGHLVEVEYHVAPDTVPASVRSAMDRLHPGGDYVDAERETHGGQVYYELKRIVDGRAVEAMFTAAGELHSAEIEVAADRVPQAVKAVVAARHPAGRELRYEEIRDGAGVVEEYHVKLVADGGHYKVLVSPAGVVLGTYLELPAEIEVPVD